MIIHQPEIIHHNESAIIYSRIELDQSRQNFPDHIWYRVPGEYAEFLGTQSDPFIAASLFIAMYFGESISVRGNTSPLLAYNLKEYQHLARFNFPDVLKPISIDFEKLSPGNKKGNAVGTSFSGGVDSLFTLKKHLPEVQSLSEYQVTHAVFIRGFDILPHEQGYYDLLFRNFEEVLKDLNIKLIEIETNMVSLNHQRLNFPNFYGPQIASPGLLFSGLFRRYFIPSSGDYELIGKASTTANPLMDRLLSNEKTQIIHHGSTHNRTDKIEAIADWHIARKLLWVCLEINSGEKKWNCSRCEKCMRTMIPLYALGKLNDFNTFRIPFQNNKDIIRYARKYKQTYNFSREFIPFIRTKKRDLLPWVRITIFFGFIRSFIVTNLPKIFQGFLRRFGYFIPRNDASDAYEVEDINLIIQEKKYHHDH